MRTRSCIAATADDAQASETVELTYDSSGARSTLLYQERRLQARRTRTDTALTLCVGAPRFSRMMHLHGGAGGVPRDGIGVALQRMQADGG
jgi:hypothetical protein